MSNDNNDDDTAIMDDGTVVMNEHGACSRHPHVFLCNEETMTCPLCDADFKKERMTLKEKRALLDLRLKELEKNTEDYTFVVDDNEYDEEVDFRGSLLMFQKKTGGSKRLINEDTDEQPQLKTKNNIVIMPPPLVNDDDPSLMLYKRGNYTLDTLASQMSRMQQRLDWTLAQRERDVAQLRSKVDAQQQLLLEKEVQLALLRERLLQQEQRMQHELKLIKLAALSSTGRRGGSKGNKEIHIQELHVSVGGGQHMLAGPDGQIDPEAIKQATTVATSAAIISARNMADKEDVPASIQTTTTAPQQQDSPPPTRTKTLTLNMDSSTDSTKPSLNRFASVGENPAEYAFSNTSNSSIAEVSVAASADNKSVLARVDNTPAEFVFDATGSSLDNDPATAGSTHSDKNPAEYVFDASSYSSNADMPAAVNKTAAPRSDHNSAEFVFDASSSSFVADIPAGFNKSVASHGDNTPVEFVFDASSSSNADQPAAAVNKSIDSRNDYRNKTHDEESTNDSVYNEDAPKEFTFSPREQDYDADEGDDDFDITKPMPTIAAAKMPTITRKATPPVHRGEPMRASATSITPLTRDFEDGGHVNKKSAALPTRAALNAAGKSEIPRGSSIPKGFEFSSDIPSTVPLQEEVTIGTLEQSFYSQQYLKRYDEVDNKSISNTVASSTYGDDRQKVFAQTLLDPYGDRGRFTGLVLRSTGMPHGVGRMVYEDDGRTFEGDWRHGRWHGHGRATFANGDSYEGEYRFDQRHGRGLYCWSDGRIYDGTFSEDKRHGKGAFKWPDGATYQGDFVQGQREGHGRYTFSDGGYYVGSWIDGRYDGFGECHWEDGRTYKGEWKTGMAHGQGVETYPDGRVRHDGQWNADEPVRSK